MLNWLIEALKPHKELILGLFGGGLGVYTITLFGQVIAKCGK